MAQSNILAKNSKRRLRIALCGPPNIGKSTIFNQLTGLRQKVANYPGVTVEAHIGIFKLPQLAGIECELIDVPGSYSLSAISPDEFVAVETLIGRNSEKDELDPPDLIMVVLDATNLDRSLYLLAQVSQAGLPTVVVLNQIDIAERRGVRVNSFKLSERLGMPVVSTVAHKGKGIPRLIETIAKTISESAEGIPERYKKPIFRFDDSIEEFIDACMSCDECDNCENGCLTRTELFRALFDVHGPAEKLFRKHFSDAFQLRLQELRNVLSKEYRGLPFAEAYPLAKAMGELASEVTVRVTPRRSKNNISSKGIDKVVLHRFWGPVILLGVMMVMFQSIFTWAAPLMNLIDASFGLLGDAVGSTMPEGAFRSLLVDGVIGGVGSVIIFLPQIVILFLFLGFLEDSGYLPRAAFIVDRLFRWCGLSGKSFVPLLSSFACAIPGIMATRVIENRRQRLLTILVAPLMSCSARLPVYTIMIAAFIPYKEYYGFFNLQGMTLMALYGLGVFVAIIVSLILKRFVHKDDTESFVMELPTFKLPTVKGIWIRTSLSATVFLRRAGTMIFAITIVIWALSYYPRSNDITQSFDDQISEIESSADERLEYIAQNVNPSLSVDELPTYLRERLAGDDSPTELAGAERQALEESLSAYELVKEIRDAQISELERNRSGAYLRESYLGKMGRTVAPAFAPLGWDWKITIAALASFPAREVVIATLGTIYNLGAGEDETSTSLIEKMRSAKWESGARIGEPVFNPAVAMSIMIFFALCAQCGATLAVIRRETNSWGWPAFTFVYMTVLAYFGAWGAYSFFSSLGV
ncbi:ferrous iron transport protein B [Gemmatimonas aurantiaca]|nr:ferrous iron transport protein B [Gemmatimonas aurantiaca]